MIVISNDFFLFQQVRAQALGSFHGLVEFPLANLGFVATEQNLRNLPSLVVGRTGVDRGGKNVVLETVGKCTLFVADDIPSRFLWARLALSMATA